MTDAGKRCAIIVGAGPAGLTAAVELLRRTAVLPIVLEKSAHMGGIARTISYKGNRIDIGGHRFFSKSDRVMQWWMEMMPVEAGAGVHRLAYRNQSRWLTVNGAGTGSGGPGAADCVWLVRPRKSRIYFLRKFFEYPVSLSARTVHDLGLWRALRIAASYLRARLAPIRPERTLEQFLINRFGKQLYLAFFKSYTEKVWGVPCEQIGAEWGAQRIQGLSLSKAVAHRLGKLWRGSPGGIAQKRTETSLIEKFLYPKFGPGQLWERAAQEVRDRGGQILTGWTVCRIHAEGARLTGVTARHEDGEVRRFDGDFFFSTMPVQELIRALDGGVPASVAEVSEGLLYRDFITVGLLLDRLLAEESGEPAGRLLKDNWIYIQEPGVLAGRMQIFNNWSPYMVADPDKVWVGLEYFCDAGGELWRRSDESMIALAVGEMEKIGLVARADVRDATVLRMEKTYPAYFGAYRRFDEIRAFVDGFENLFLVGRNGMHKYNNQDHSMLTAMTAVDNIAAGRLDKSNIWAVNTEMEYQETYGDEPG